MPSSLDPLLSYLLYVNALSFLLNALDFWMRRLARGKIRPLILDLLTVSGGAAGTLLAFLLWDVRTRKRNAWRHVLTFSSLVVWCSAVVYAEWMPFDGNALVANLHADHTPGLIYLAAVSAVTFFAFVIDKIKARAGRWRISEGWLLGLSLAGGTIGGLLAMAICRHKIRSPQFRYGLPLMLVAQIVALSCLVQAGLV